MFDRFQCSFSFRKAFFSVFHVVYRATEVFGPNRPLESFFLFKKVILLENQSKLSDRPVRTIPRLPSAISPLAIKRQRTAINEVAIKRLRDTFQFVGFPFSAKGRALDSFSSGGSYYDHSQTIEQSLLNRYHWIGTIRTALHTAKSSLINCGEVFSFSLPGLHSVFSPSPQQPVLIPSFPSPVCSIPLYSISFHLPSIRWMRVESLSLSKRPFPDELADGMRGAWMFTLFDCVCVFGKQKLICKRHRCVFGCLTIGGSLNRSF